MSRFVRHLWRSVLAVSLSSSVILAGWAPVVPATALDTGANASTQTPDAAPTASTSPAAASASPAESTTEANLDNERVAGVIVKYRDGVIVTKSLTPPGAARVTSAKVVDGTPMVDGMSLLSLETSVDLATAYEVAEQLERDPRVEWAEPNATRYAIVDSPSLDSVSVNVVASGIHGSVTKTNAFTFSAVLPVISSLSVTSGPLAGGTTVTITGSQLGSTSSVKFGKSAATLSSVSDTSIVLTTPPATIGTQDIVVTTIDGTTTLADGFTYVAVPTIASVSPNVGQLTGGQAVTLTGTHLSTIATLTIGGTSVSPTVVDETHVTFTTPAKAAGPVGISLATAGGTASSSNAFTYAAPPTISTLSKTTGSTSGNTSVTISGTNLSWVTDVSFGGTVGTVSTKTPTSVVVTTPARVAGTVGVTIAAPNGSATKLAAFTFAPSPTASSLNKTEGPLAAGTVVTLTGTNLTGVTGVTVGGTAATAVSAVSSTSVRFTVPAKPAGTYSVVVTTPYGSATLSNAYSYLAAPTLASLSVVSGYTTGGQSVTLTGTNLASTTSVTFGGTLGTIVSRTGTSVVVTTPARAAGSVGVIATTPGGSSVSRSFSFVAPPPTISGISPNAGPRSGGQTVTITGTGFTGATSVTLGTGSSAVSVRPTVVSNTQLRIVTPAGSAGAKAVSVLAPGGTASVASTSGYTYVSAPTVTAVSPASGPTTGGTTIVITGTNLKSPTSVTVGGAAAVVSSSTATSISVVTPAGSAGVKNVVVVTAGGTATKSAGFTYVLAPSALRGGNLLSSDGSVDPARLAMPPTFPVASGSAQSRVRDACAVPPTDSVVYRCFDDSDADAGASYDAEIIFSDAYVSTLDKSTVIADVVPFVNISSDTWLTRSDTVAAVYFDSNNDNTADVVLYAPNVTLVAGASTSVIVLDWNAANSRWDLRTDTGRACDASLTRATGTHFAFAGVTKQWWRFSAQSSCLFGAGAQTVRMVAVLEDSLFPDGDYSPNGWSGPFMDLVAATSASPVVTSLSTASGSNAGGTTVSLFGTNLDSTTKVTIGGISASIVSRTSSEVVVTTSRTVAVGNVDVVLTTPGGSDTLESAFSFTSAAPIITSVSPDVGRLAGGQTVTLTGTNLAGISVVMFGDAPATVVSVSETSVVIVTPPASAGFTPSAPSEPAFVDGTLWGLTGDYGVHVSEAWKRTQGASDVIVAVLDTGITTHSDLGPQVPGYDMVSLSRSNDSDGRDANPADPGDWCTARGTGSSWHGTHVQGTVNAALNGAGSVGVAPNVKVQPIRVLGTCGGDTADIVMGIYWAAGKNVGGLPINTTPADVISLSLGGSGGCMSSEQAAIDYAVSRNIVVTIAAGNDNDFSANFSPGNCNNVITVGATDSDGTRATFSNYGSLVEISAPGVDIYSTVNAGTTVPMTQSYASWNGTSMATPHVAAVVALMLSRNPSLTPAQVLERIQATATPFSGGVCDYMKVKTCGSGIINAGLAVQ